MTKLYKCRYINLKEQITGLLAKIVVFTITGLLVATNYVDAQTTTVANNSVVTIATGTTVSTPGSIIINSGGTISKFGDIMIGGSWTNNGTYTDNSGTITFNGTTGGLTIAGTLNGATGKFNNIVFNGVGGNWTFLNDAETKGNFIITNGSVTAPTTLAIGGNWDNSGTFNHNGGTVTLIGLSNQSVGGANSTNFNNLLLNNSTGATLTKPEFVITNFNLANGVLTTTSANILTVNNTSAAGITGGSTTSFVDGPLRWLLPTLAASGSYIFPVGNNNIFYPFTVAGLTTTTPTVTVQAFNANSGGTPGTDLCSLSTTEYWKMDVNAGTFSDGNVSLTRQAPLGFLDAIGRSTTAAGTYDNLNGTVAGTSINNSDPVGAIAAGNSNYFVMALKKPVISESQVEPTTCASADGSITISVSGSVGPFSYAWTGPGVNPTSQNQTNLTFGIYNVTVTDNTTGCQRTAQYILFGPGGCFACPTLPSLTTNPAGTTCSGTNVTITSSGMTNMGITYGVTFKYSLGAPLGNPYVGGTNIATVPNGSLTAGGTTATTSTSFATGGTYYIYAILSPTPVDPTCRPSNLVILTVNNTPTFTPGTNPVVCSGTTTAYLPYTSTYTGPISNLIVNGGFETGGSSPWVVASAVPAPVVNGTSPHTGSFAWALGKYGAPGDAPGDCSVYQTVTIPAEGATLSYWYKPTSADVIADDWQDAYITNSSGGILATIMHVASNSNAWTNVTSSMNAYAGQTVRVMFLVHNDGDGNPTNMYIDDIAVTTPGGGPSTYSITWNAPAPAQGFVNVTNAVLPASPLPIAVPAAAAPGTYTGTINVTNLNGCSLATPQTFTVTINPIPVVNQPANQVLCNGATTAAVSFTSPTTGPGTIVYTWVHTGANIGLGPNGVGDIPAFTAINTGNTPAVATITVVPTYNFGGVSCTGQPKSFTITVNPTPTVNPVANQTVCHNTATAAVTFSGSVAGTVYNWTNSNATIGLAAAGSGNIASFTATNPGTAPVVATITVTPTANGCTGSTTSFTITVNPRPTVNAVANQTVCNNSATTAVNFTSPSGATTTYAWTNSNTAIGLAASGTGNIPSFIATNTTALPISGTITVTPSFAGCAGTPLTFTITVNASPTVDPVPGNQLLCSGSASAPITLTGPVSGAFYTWTNNAPSIGLAAVGAGNIPSFIATNTSGAPVTATVTVTGSFTTGGVTCTGPSVSFTITVNPSPSTNAITNQTLCNGATTAAVTISGPVPGTVFSWTNNNTSIGLAASGSGNIGSFIAINNTNAPVVATITVNSDFSSGGLNCSGTPVTFTITVNPTPTVSAVSSQIVCNGSPTAAVNFAGAVAGTTFNWTNSNTAIGLAASGSGNIASFTATNATAAPISGTITVTPVFATCTGTPITFTITVNPTATVNQPANQTLCNGASTAAVNFTGTPAGVTFSWTNNNTTIGLVASGTGNIPSFVATNTTQAPVTATITVTPSIAGAICTGASKTFTITVNPQTNITFTNAPPKVCLSDTTVILTATPAGGVWSGPGVVGNTFSASLAGVGVKTLTYTTTSGCGTSATVNITVNDCIERHNTFATSIRIYPNPSSGQFFIRFLSDLYKEFNVKIIDNDGRVLRDFHFGGLMYGSVIPMNLRNLPSDTYILQVYNAQEKANFRFVIAH